MASDLEVLTLHIQLQTIPAHVGGYDVLKPAEPQKAEEQSLDTQAEHCHI